MGHEQVMMQGSFHLRECNMGGLMGHGVDRLSRMMALLYVVS